MTLYRVRVLPNVEEYITEVDEESVEKAIEEAERIASKNCYFMATEDDVEEVKNA